MSCCADDHDNLTVHQWTPVDLAVKSKVPCHLDDHDNLTVHQWTPVDLAVKSKVPCHLDADIFANTCI